MILGPSGSGKTTLLRCVAGFEKPDAGTISIDGKPVTDLPPRERDLAMVFQSYALFPLMTIHDNIGFPLKVRNVPKAEIDARVNQVADLLVIKHLLEKKPGQLSGGEQQRAALGRAIVRQPNALLMDEPLTSLDAPLRAQMRTELKRIRRETQMTAIYVTHDQAEAMALADMIAIMSDGHLMQYGPPLRSTRNPITRSWPDSWGTRLPTYSTGGSPWRAVEGPSRSTRPPSMSTPLQQRSSPTRWATAQRCSLECVLRTSTCSRQRSLIQVWRSWWRASNLSVPA